MFVVISYDIQEDKKRNRLAKKLKDFGIDYNLGPASEVVDIYISVEGIRQ